MLAYIYPVNMSTGRPDNSLPGVPGSPDNSLPGMGGSPSHPIVVPPLPGIWPPPGQPTFPIALPPGEPTQPIYIEGSPEHPITMPPATIWPPLPPVGPTGKYAILILVVGVGYRWLVVEGPGPSHPIAPQPPEAQPKRA